MRPGSESSNTGQRSNLLGLYYPPAGRDIEVSNSTDLFVMHVLALNKNSRKIPAVPGPQVA